MQKKWIIAGIAAGGFVVLLIIASFVMGIVSLGQNSNTPAVDVITVYGQGKVTAASDIAYITLGYENSASSPQEAQTANAARMTQLNAALQETGVAEADIQQSQFNVYQEYYYGDTPDAQSYRVSSILKVTVRRVDRATAIVTAACAAGANTSYGITFDLNNRQKVYEQALSLARERADEKAEEMASELGRELDGIAEVTEGSAIPYIEASDYGDSGTPVDYVTGTASPGGLEIGAVVHVTYRLK